MYSLFYVILIYIILKFRNFINIENVVFFSLLLKVPPAELEEILLNHPAVFDAGVTSVPDENAGELPIAFVVKQPGKYATKEEIINYVAGMLRMIF